MHDYMPTAPRSDLNREILETLDGAWRSAGQIQRLLGYGQVLEVARSLECLWQLGLIERHSKDIGLAARKASREKALSFHTYRRKQRGRA